MNEIENPHDHSRPWPAPSGSLAYGAARPLDPTNEVSSMNDSVDAIKRDVAALFRRHGIEVPAPPSMTAEENERQLCRGEYLGHVGREALRREPPNRAAAIEAYRQHQAGRRD